MAEKTDFDTNEEFTEEALEIYFESLPEEEKEKYYRKLDNLKFTDDVVFGVIMTKKTICQRVLSVILGKKITDIRAIEEQKAIKILPRKKRDTFRCISSG